MSRFLVSPIRDAVATLEALYGMAKEMKNAIDSMAGRSGPAGFAALYIQGTAPDSPHPYSIWIDTSQGNKVRVWMQNQWASTST